MPKATSSKTTTTKSKSTGAAESAGGATTKAPRGKNTASPPPSPPRVPLLDKHLVYQIILAKLEESTKCDWFALSTKLAAGGIGNAGGGGGGKGKGKAGAGGGGTKGKRMSTTDKAANGDAMSGTDLHDLYHNTILPGLRAGRALWRDTDDDAAMGSQRSGRSLSSGKMEGGDDEEDECEYKYQEEPMSLESEE